MKRQVSQRHPIDWMVGVRMIADWAKSESLIDLKGTVLGKQLGQMTRESLPETERPNFYAVDALRCMINEFESRPCSGFVGPPEMPAEAWT